MKRVLIIEGEEFWRRRFGMVLVEPKGVRIIFAPSLEKARWQISRGPNIDILVVDGAEGTLDFVQEIRRGFSGKIIICSSDANVGDMFLEAGCDEYACKSHLSKLLAEKLWIESDAPILCSVVGA